eukprot:363361-Chlamydomonas_euryale.AAC.1
MLTQALLIPANICAGTSPSFNAASIHADSGPPPPRVEHRFKARGAGVAPNPLPHTDHTTPTPLAG